MADSKRLFLACWPDQSLQETLYSVARRLQREYGGRKTRRENIHMTLIFLGQVEPQKEEELRIRLRQIKAAPFELVIDKAGAFPRARVSWVGPSVQPDALNALYKALRQATDELGFELEDRPFRPHVTLLRKSRNVITQDIKPLSWQVGSFYLIESVQDREGVHYRVTEEFRFTEEEIEGKESQTYPRSRMPMS